MLNDVKNLTTILTYPIVNIETDFTDGKLKPELIVKYIEDHAPFISKFNTNLDFFTGKNVIISYKRDVTAPNNVINIPYAKTITNTIKGYMYKPRLINYDLNEDIGDSEYFDKFKKIYKINYEEVHNSELGESQSKYGIAFELLYIDNVDGTAITKFKQIKPQELIPIFDNTLNNTLICAIRYYAVDENTSQVIIYYANSIEYYLLNTRKQENEKLTFQKEELNYFGDIPIVIYINNEEYTADYEPVNTLIQMYDKLMTDSANEFDRFAAAYLILQNYILGANDEEARRKMERLKELRVFEIGNDGKIQFLTKDIPTAFISEIKNILRDDIAYHSQVPDFRDTQFGTASGIAIKYKLIGFENLCASKEAYFKKGLERRLKLINKILKIQNEVFEDSITITFNRNIPDNEMEKVDIVTKLQGIISQDTLLGIIPFIDDVEKEKEKLKAEKEEAEKEFDIDNIETDNEDENIDINKMPMEEGMKPNGEDNK